MSIEQPHVPESIPTAIISDQAPLDTGQYREHPVFLTADPEGQIPDVTLRSAPLDPRDRPHHKEQRVGIFHEGEDVGTLNLAQLPAGATWIRGVEVYPEKRGRGLGLATYLGVIAAAHNVGRQVRSDPAGLSPEPGGDSPARHVWGSLVRRGVADAVEGQQDQHGNPRFISKPPGAK